MVGGIRIKSISNYDCDNKLVEKRNFYYVNDKGESSGVAGPEPLFVRYYVEKYTKQAEVGGTTIADDLCIGIEEVNGENLCRYTGSAVLYSQVIEETQISEEKKYRTKYCYKNAEISYPYASPNLFKNRMEQLTFGESGYREGILTNTIINKTGENSDYKPIQNNVNYTTILEKTPYTFVQRCISLRNILGYNEIKRIPASEKYYYGTYELVSAKILPTQTEIYQYLDGDTIVQTTKNVYENDDYIYPTRTEVYAGNGNKIISDYRYSFDYTDDEAINVLKSRNVISQPIRVSTKYGRSSTIIDTKYARFGDSLIKPSLKTSVSKGDTIEVEYLAYDSYGNLLYAKLNDIHAKFYLWSYCGKLPIAEITGGDYTYAQIVSAITTAFGLSINELSSMATPNADVLCNGKLQSLLPKANVTTFTYDSANCVATITDTNGLTNKYEYDDFDRLTRVMSPVVSDGGSVASAIVKSYEYNYKGVEE
jgi:YD repeat-containing protein